MSRLRIGEKIPGLYTILVEYSLADRNAVCRMRLAREKSQLCSEACVNSPAAGNLTAGELSNKRTGLFPGHDGELLVLRQFTLHLFRVQEFMTCRSAGIEPSHDGLLLRGAAFRKSERGVAGWLPALGINC